MSSVADRPLDAVAVLDDLASIVLRAVNAAAMPPATRRELQAHLEGARCDVTGSTVGMRRVLDVIADQQQRIA